MAKNSQVYWEERINEIAQHRFDLSNDAMQSELKKIYDNVASKMEKEVEELYFKLLEDEIKRSDLYTYNRYKHLEKQINAEMVALGNKEVTLLNKSLDVALAEIYKDTSIIPGANVFAMLEPQTVKAIVSRPWGGHHFSSTIWKNKELLAQQLKKGISECIITGKSKDRLVKKMRDTMNTGFNNADRVVRTELMHTLNQGQMQRYKDDGYTQVKWMVAFDARTCEECASKEGKVVAVGSGDIPPAHPRCRCTIVPVIE